MFGTINDPHSAFNGARVQILTESHYGSRHVRILDRRATDGRTYPPMAFRTETVILD